MRTASPPADARCTSEFHTDDFAGQVAVQLFGGMGVVSDHPVERLYREIRALRIYEGASEVQQLIIARELLREAAVDA